MCTLKSPDGKFRLFNWNLEVPRTEEQYYFCLIMKYDERSDDYVIIELFDKIKIGEKCKILSIYRAKLVRGTLLQNCARSKGLKNHIHLIGLGTAMTKCLIRK